MGETLRRIIGKAVCMATRVDVKDLCGTDQLCGGKRSGIEGAVHATNDLFAQHHDSVPGWGVLLVDASNAFNSLNRSALLWNARVLWPRCSRFLFNTYRGWAVLYVRGAAELLYSREGVTQGGPLSMFLNQARAGRRPARAWFLKIDPVRIVGMRACVCVCVCVRARGYQ